MKQWEREDGGTLGIPDSPSERKFKVEVPFGGVWCVGERGGARHDVISGIAALGCLAASPVTSLRSGFGFFPSHPTPIIQSDISLSQQRAAPKWSRGCICSNVHVLNHGKQVL
jgi:hypothetical protein